MGVRNINQRGGVPVKHGQVDIVHVDHKIPQHMDQRIPRPALPAHRFQAGEVCLVFFRPGFCPFLRGQAPVNIHNLFGKSDRVRASFRGDRRFRGSFRRPADRPLHQRIAEYAKAQEQGDGAQEQTAPQGAAYSLPCQRIPPFLYCVHFSLVFTVHPSSPAVSRCGMIHAQTQMSLRTNVFFSFAVLCFCFILWLHALYHTVTCSSTKCALSGKQKTRPSGAFSASIRDHKYP